MGIFDFKRLFDLNHDGMLDPLEKGLVILFKRYSL